MNYALPIGGDRLFVNCHIGAVTSVAISFDNSLLFTTGEDGVLCVFNIRDKDNKIRNPEWSFFSDKVQTKTEIEEKANQLRTAEAERADLEMTFKTKKEMTKSTHKSKEARIREEGKGQEPNSKRKQEEGEKRSRNEQQREREALDERMGRSNRPTRRGVPPEIHISAQSAKHFSTRSTEPRTNGGRRSNKVRHVTFN
jgi:hypothetical protein